MHTVLLPDWNTPTVLDLLTKYLTKLNSSSWGKIPVKAVYFDCVGLFNHDLTPDSPLRKYAASYNEVIGPHTLWFELDHPVWIGKKYNPYIQAGFENFTGNCGIKAISLIRCYEDMRSLWISTLERYIRSFHYSLLLGSDFVDGLSARAVMKHGSGWQEKRDIVKNMRSGNMLTLYWKDLSAVEPLPLADYTWKEDVQQTAET